jgi:tetratricopeptide (TPR) repeat protein
VHASLGRYPAAEQALQRSIELSREHNPDVDHPSIGYNLGLLGKIYLEMGRVEAAEEVMREAVRISEAAEQADLLGLVRNFHAELLMHPGRPPADREEAERVLLRNLDESRAAGIHRSAVQAASLLGLLMLRRATPDDALVHSQQAVDELERLGDMPAVRTEEILFNHHQVLRAAGKPAEAAAYLDRARRLVQRKAGDLKKPELKTSFLENVPLNRGIRDAHTAG